MRSEELAALVAELRQEGYDARNLGAVGITIWHGAEGHFYPAQELRQFSGLVARRNFDEIRSKRASAGQ